MNHVIARFLLSGRVQGVGCRNQVYARAVALGGLEGWVRNLEDGRVEVLARGSPDKVTEFESTLRHGMGAPVRVEALHRDGVPPGFSRGPSLRSGVFGVEADASMPLPLP